MKNVCNRPQIIMVLGLFIIAGSAIAWQTVDGNSKKDSAEKTQYEQRDTTRPGKSNNDKAELRMKELDKAMKQLDVQMSQLDVQLKGLNITISKEVTEALSKIDFDQIGKQVNEELRKIDFEKIGNDINIELNKIDKEQIKADVKKALAEAQIELSKVDREAIQKEIKKAQLEINNPKLKKEIENSLKEAKKEIEKAKNQLMMYKHFTEELQNDGLINTAKGYSVEWKANGNLLINGQQQSKEITDKYRKYFKKGGYKIHSSNEDDLNIDNGEDM
jgi:hypothetical protein